MDIRKVQMTGGSSYIVTLPKEWIERHGIKKNDPVTLNVREDGTLLINPSGAIVGEETVSRSITYDVTEISNYNFFFRLLVASYFMGYTEAIIKSERRLTASIRDATVHFCQLAIGPEIVDETDTRIVIKDLLNPSEMPFDRTIRRMHVLVKNMHRDAIAALLNVDRTLAEKVRAGDTEVDRLHWLVAHQFNLVNLDARLALKMNLQRENILIYFLISRFLERIGDHGEIIASNVLTLMDRSRIDSIGPEVKTAIAEASREGMKLLDASIDAWIKKDIKQANDTIEQVDRVRPMCERIDHLASQQGFDIASSIPVGYIAESTRRLAEYSGDIGEIVINALIREFRSVHETSVPDD